MVSLLFAGVAYGADMAVNDEIGRWYIAPKLGATFTDSSRGADDDLFYGVALGKHLNDDWSAELNLVSGKHDGERNASDVRISAVSADVLRVFNRGGSFAPFLTAGAGLIDDDLTPGTDHKSFMAQAGVGALIHSWKSARGDRAFSLRPEAKARWDGNHGQGHPLDVLVGLAFELSFGAPRPVPTLAAPMPAPAAPPAEVPAEPAVVDSDNDGVIDGDDRCPGTPRGTAVDTVGCPLKGSITLVGVRFENDSSKLAGDSAAVLDPLAASLKSHPGLQIEVQGHTDAVGSAPYNLKLSQARAEAVREYLLAQGVAAPALTAKGYGESQPVADNATAAGRAQNRRVVLVVLENPGEVEVKQSGDLR